MLIPTPLLLGQTEASPPHPDAGTETRAHHPVGEGSISLDNFGPIGPLEAYRYPPETEWDPCRERSDRPIVFAETIRLNRSSHGGVSARSDLNAEIRRHRSAIERCYSRALSANPGLCGLVVVSFEVNARGRVQNAIKDKSSLGATRVEACTLATVRRLVFEPQEKRGIYLYDRNPVTRATLRFTFVAGSAKPRVRK